MFLDQDFVLLERSQNYVLVKHLALVLLLSIRDMRNSGSEKINSVSFWASEFLIYYRPNLRAKQSYLNPTIFNLKPKHMISCAFHFVYSRFASNSIFAWDRSRLATVDWEDKDSFIVVELRGIRLQLGEWSIALQKRLWQVWIGPPQSPDKALGRFTDWWL